MNDTRRFNIIKQTLNPSTVGMMYRIHLSGHFNRTVWYSVIVHSSRSSMLYDTAYSSKKYYDTNDATFYPIELRYLPYPYQTNCQHINRTSGAELILDRVRDKIRDMNIVDTVSPKFIPYDYPMVTASKLRNRTFQNKYRSYIEEAEEPLTPCKFKCIITRASAYKSDPPFVSIF